MAWSGNGSNSLSLADNAALTLTKSTGWSIVGWIKSASRTGSSDEALIRWGAYNAAPFLWLSLGQVSYTYSNRLVLLQKGTSGSLVQAISNDATNGKVADTNWHHLALVCNGTAITIYLDGVAQSQTSAVATDIDVAAAMTLGSSFNGSLAEWAKYNVALSSGTITALVGGNSVAWYRDSIAWDLRLLADATELIVPLTVTNNGGSFGAGPTLSYPGFEHFQRVMTGGMQEMGV